MRAKGWRCAGHVCCVALPPPAPTAQPWRTPPGLPPTRGCCIGGAVYGRAGRAAWAAWSVHPAGWQAPPHACGPGLKPQVAREHVGRLITGAQGCLARVACAPPWGGGGGGGSGHARGQPGPVRARGQPLVGCAHSLGPHRVTTALRGLCFRPWRCSCAAAAGGLTTRCDVLRRPCRCSVPRQEAGAPGASGAGHPCRCVMGV